MQVTQTSWLYSTELTALQKKGKQTAKWATVRMYHVQETQPTWLLKDMHGMDSKPQVFYLNLNCVVKGGAAKAV